MTISATTQGLRMGVATSSSRPTVPFDGQVISETDTDTLKVYNGTAWAPVSGLVRIGGGTLSSTTTNFDNVFSSTYLSYLITVNGAVTSGTGITLTLRYAGPTTLTSGYYGGVLAGTNAGSTSSIGTNNAAAFNLSTSTSVQFNGTIMVTQRSDIGVASFNTAFQSDANNTVHNGGGQSSGVARNYLGFALNTSGGFTSGTVNIYGYALS